MGVRVWGVVEDRLVEVRAEPGASGTGIRIEGLPADRVRTTADRVRAALVNTRLVGGTPAVTIRLEPAIPGGPTSELDLAIALALLASAGLLGSGLRWILASGRLGLNGSVHVRELEEPSSVVRIVTALR
jgi:magnesium chelatase family protein